MSEFWKEIVSLLLQIVKSGVTNCPAASGSRLLREGTKFVIVAEKVSDEKKNGVRQSITSLYYPNKLACVPISIKTNIRASISFSYIKSQSGKIWHSDKCFTFPFNL